MRNSIENWLQSIWYSDSSPPWYLRMLVPLYSAGFKFDHRQSRSNKSNSSNPNFSNRNSGNRDSGSDISSPEHLEANSVAPLLVVGNITVGGSGKTPLVITLCKIALEMGLNVGVASTGYGRKSTETLTVQADSNPSECGDEPVLIAIRTGVPVVVARLREEAVAQLKQIELDLIISDDGLQSAGLQRDIEICVVDGARGLGNGYLLPAGPLREPASRLHEVDYVVSNGDWPSKPTDVNAGQMMLVGRMLYSIDGSEQVTLDEFFNRQAQQQTALSIHLFAGIGNPERFFKAVRQLNLGTSGESASAPNWHEHRFADHHAFKAEDFALVADGAPIVMTEKDAVKCRKLGLNNAWYLPVDGALDEQFVQWFCQQLKLLKQDKP